MIGLAKQAPPEGCFAEVGVYKGGSLKLLAMTFPDRHVFGFDSFEGLPIVHWTDTEIHRPGEFGDTSQEAVGEFLGEYQSKVHLVKGIFPASASLQEQELFTFVHVDTDFYLSVKACLEWFWPRLLPGGIIVVDDYLWPACPGVERALIEFGQPFQQTEAAYQAFLLKE